MRANIDLNDELVEKARRLTGLKTKRAIVEEALETLVRLHEHGLATPSPSESAGGSRSRPQPP